MLECTAKALEKSFAIIVCISGEYTSDYFCRKGESFSVTSGSSSSFILPSSCGVQQYSVLGPILYKIYVSPIASIVSSHDVNQQQYADDSHHFFFLSLHLHLAVSAASSGVSLLITAGSSTMVWF